MSEVDDKGTKITRFSEYTSELNQLGTSTISSDLNTSGDSVFSATRNVINREFSDLSEMIQEVAANYTVNGAEGTALQELALLNGIYQPELLTDSELYITRESQLSGDDCVSTDYLTKKLREIEGVTYAKVLENNTNATVDGIPAYQYECVINGGNPDTIYQTIWDYGANGIISHGNLSSFVDDVEGLPQEVKYTKPDPLYVGIEVTYSLYSEESPSEGIEESIKDAVISYGETLNVGDDVVMDAMLPYIYRNTSGLGDISIEGEGSATSLTYMNTLITIEGLEQRDIVLASSVDTSPYTPVNNILLLGQDVSFPNSTDIYTLQVDSQAGPSSVGENIFSTTVFKTYLDGGGVQLYQWALLYNDTGSGAGSTNIFGFEMEVLDFPTDLGDVNIVGGFLTWGIGTYANKQEFIDDIIATAQGVVDDIFTNTGVVYNIVQNGDFINISMDTSTKPAILTDAMALQPAEPGYRNANNTILAHRDLSFTVGRTLADFRVTNYTCAAVLNAKSSSAITNPYPDQTVINYDSSVDMELFNWTNTPPTYSPSNIPVSKREVSLFSKSSIEVVEL